MPVVVILKLIDLQHRSNGSITFLRKYAKTYVRFNHKICNLVLNTWNIAFFVLVVIQINYLTYISILNFCFCSIQKLKWLYQILVTVFKMDNQKMLVFYEAPKLIKDTICVLITSQ